MTFYRPRVAWIGNWLVAAVAGDSLYRSVTVPPVSTTQAALVTAFTAVTHTNQAVSGAGNGTYYSSTGTQLCQTTDNNANTLFPAMPGNPYRTAMSSMLGEASSIGSGVPLAPYLAAGLRYDYDLGVTVNPNPIETDISGVLTIMIVDGSASSTPSPTQAATGTSSHYNYTTGSGTSTGSVNIWLDASYSHQVHVLSCWGAQASGLPAGNWWPAGDGFQTAVHGLVSVYQSLAVGANEPTSSVAVNSPIAYALDTSERWAIIAWESDLVPAPYVPSVAVPSRLATIVG